MRYTFFRKVQNASLYGAKMQGVEAYQADFRGADLRLANLGGAYLDGAMLPPLTAAKQALPSPSEVAASNRFYKPEKPGGNEQGRERHDRQGK